MGKQVTVLLGGGIDSASLIPLYKLFGWRIDALHFDYGQPSCVGERQAALSICHHYSVDLNVARLCPSMIRERSGEYRGRNAMLLLAAASRSRDARLVAIGIHSGTSFYDASEQFVGHMRALFDGYFMGTIQMDAPFLDFSKRGIIEYAQQAGVPIELTFSCERASEKPCGTCLSCLERMMILENS